MVFKHMTAAPQANREKRRKVQIIADNGPCKNAVSSTLELGVGSELQRVTYKDIKTFTAMQGAVCALSHSMIVIQDCNSVPPSRDSLSFSITLPHFIGGKSRTTATVEAI